LETLIFALEWDNPKTFGDLSKREEACHSLNIELFFCLGEKFKVTKYSYIHKSPSTQNLFHPLKIGTW
jgi:hypothetical protein